MSLTEKLGKMGIPGFRSATKWKMILATVAYLFLFIAIIPSPPNTQEKPKSIDTTTALITSTPVITPVPTVIQIQAHTPIIFNEANDLPPSGVKNYTYIDFFKNAVLASDKILINATLTANLGTIIEINDKTDIGCLDVVNNKRGAKMASGRYYFQLGCSQLLDLKSAIVRITNPEQYQAISYMIKIETIESD